MKINYCSIFLMLALVAVITVGMALFISFRIHRISRISTGSLTSYGSLTSTGSLELNMNDNDLYFASAFDANDGFVVNPYQTSDPEQKLAVMIAVSVVYILKEIRTFTMFAVLLAVIGLASYVIIISIVLNRTAKPVVKPPKPVETGKDIFEGEDDMTLTIKEHGGGNTPDIHSVKGAVIGKGESVTGSSDVMKRIDNNKELNEYIEKQTYRTALLSLSIDEMLSDVDSAIERNERSKIKQRFL